MSTEVHTREARSMHYKAHHDITAQRRFSKKERKGNGIVLSGLCTRFFIAFSSPASSVAALHMRVSTPQICALVSQGGFTSRKPLMKLLGSRALGSSSARKYLSTWDSCFQ